MALLSLTCTNCSAPLQVGDDLVRFACAHCGTTQIVERAGGIVALRKVEGAIQAVQRGTDRTAAELAMPRLQGELQAAHLERQALIKAVQDKHASARGGRLGLSIIVFFVFFMGLMFTVMALAEKAPDWILQIVTYGGLLVALALTVWVFRTVKLPPKATKATTAELDARIERINAQIKSYRAILDQNLS